MKFRLSFVRGNELRDIVISYTPKKLEIHDAEGRELTLHDYNFTAAYVLYRTGFDIHNLKPESDAAFLGLVSHLYKTFDNLLDRKKVKIEIDHLLS